MTTTPPETLPLLGWTFNGIWKQEDLDTGLFAQPPCGYRNARNEESSPKGADEAQGVPVLARIETASRRRSAALAGSRSSHELLTPSSSTSSPSSANIIRRTGDRLV